MEIVWRAAALNDLESIREFMGIIRKPQFRLQLIGLGGTLGSVGSAGWKARASWSFRTRLTSLPTGPEKTKFESWR